MKSLRILFVNDTDRMEGGSQIYLVSTMEALRARGHSVRLVAGKEEQKHSFASYSFTQTRTGYLRYLDRLWNPSASRTIRAAAAEFKPDIIHLNYGADSVSICGMAAVSAPRVVSFHDVVLLDPTLYGTEGHPLYRLYVSIWTRLAQGVLRSYDASIAPSQFVQRIAQRKGFTQCTVIPNGASLARASAVPKTKEVLFVGKFIESKGIFTLLEAFAKSRVKHPRARLVLVGDGPDREAVITTIAKLGLESAVKLYPHLDRAGLNKRYTAARLVVIPSVIPESFNLVRIEAMSAGRPVIVTPVGGMPENIHNGKDAIILADTKQETLEQAMDLLLSDHPRCSRIGAQAARTAATLSVPKHIDQLEALYARLLSVSLRKRRS